jgi:hypothetical protein
MGELIGVVCNREGTIAGNASMLERLQLSNSEKFSYLCSFNADNHKYVQAYALGYDKCDFRLYLEAANSIRRMSEEKNA